ncbi:MAG: NAD-dependent epimerase/dehydratase family protein [Pseudoflavonifractor sp.]
MEEIYVVTGACGHLGNTIVKKLLAMGRTVRALCLPEEPLAALAGASGAAIYRGDVRDPASLLPLFAHGEGQHLVVIHTAALISIQAKISPLLRAVNVGGVQNIVAACLANPGTRLLHVSSVHALPEQPGHGVIRESDQFHPQWVQGAYAKTKAEAAQYVLDAVHHKGLDASIVLPAGILGPGDYGANNINRTIRDCVTGHLHTLVVGGYDLIDVRDVAEACIAAADRGKTGESYILSARHYDWREVAGILEQNDPEVKVRHFFSPAVLQPLAPILELHAKLRKTQPLFTGYSLYCMRSNDHFSARKAQRDLGLTTRPIEETLRDTAAWELKKHAAAVQARLRVAASSARTSHSSPTK